LTRALSQSAKYEAGYEAAKAFFEDVRARVASAIDVADVARTVDLDGRSMGASKEEIAYRRWCLEKRLFLNPLNDLGTYAIAGRDVLMLPSFVTPIGRRAICGGGPQRRRRVP
jgi:hypothetical protein